MSAKVLARNWWVIVLRGVLAVLFGLIAFGWPTVTFGALVIFFGAYALVDGVFAAWAGLAHINESPHWWVFVLEGLVGVAAGVATFLWPGATGLVLLYLIAAWAIITGFLEIAAAVRLRRLIQNEWVLGLSGLVSLALGVLLVLQPRVGAVALVWTIGAYAIIFGILFIVLGFRLRTWNVPRGRGMFQPS